MAHCLPGPQPLAGLLTHSSSNCVFRTRLKKIDDTVLQSIIIFIVTIFAMFAFKLFVITINIYSSICIAHFSFALHTTYMSIYCIMYFTCIFSILSFFYFRLVCSFTSSSSDCCDRIYFLYFPLYISIFIHFFLSMMGV